MSLNDEVYVMSFLYEALGKYIEYCERKHKDFNQEGFILITQKFIENLLPQQKSKGLVIPGQVKEDTAVLTPRPLAQAMKPMEPLAVKSIEPVTVKEIKPLDKVAPATTSVNDSLRSSQTSSSQIQSSTCTSSTSQRLSSFSNILAKRHT